MDAQLLLQGLHTTTCSMAKLGSIISNNTSLLDELNVFYAGFESEHNDTPIHTPQPLPCEPSF